MVTIIAMYATVHVAEVNGTCFHQLLQEALQFALCAMLLLNSPQAFRRHSWTGKPPTISRRRFSTTMERRSPPITILVITRLHGAEKRIIVQRWTFNR